MVIGISGTKSKGRFAIRALLAYSVRQEGVARIRVGGGLNPADDRAAWTKQMEQRNTAAGHPEAVKHIWVSVTNEEYARLGAHGLEQTMDTVAKELDLAANHQIGAIHNDANHWHAHHVYSRIRPDLSLTSDSHEKRKLRKIANDYEKLLGQTTTKMYGAAVNEGARNIENWNRLPSFARWSKIAAKVIRINEASTGEQYAAKWAQLGVWYEPRTSGGILRTKHAGRTIQIKAGTAGFTPPKNWRIPGQEHNTIAGSAYEKMLEYARTQLTLNEPTYRRFIQCRNEWEKSGQVRAKLIRLGLRTELAEFDREAIRARSTLVGRERATFDILIREARVALKDRHRVVRAEIAATRPSTRYGEWLRAQAKAGEEAAVLVLQREKNRRKRKSSHHSETEEHSVNSSDERTRRDVSSAVATADGPVSNMNLQAGFDAFGADDVALSNDAMYDLATAQVNFAKTQTPVSAKGAEAVAAVEQHLQHLPPDVNRSRVLDTLDFVKRNPDIEFKALVSKNDVSQGDSARARAVTFVAIATAALEYVDRITAPPESSVMKKDAMALAIDAYAATVPEDTRAAGAQLAAAVRGMHKDTTFRVPTGTLNATHIESLTRQVDMARTGQPIRISLIPATGDAEGWTADQKTQLKNELDEALRVNRSWATFHDVMANNNLDFRVVSNEKAGRTYRGAVIYETKVIDDKKIAKFALKPSDINHGLSALERRLGDYVLPSQVKELQERHAAQPAAVNVNDSPATAPSVAPPAIGEPAQNVDATQAAHVPENDAADGELSSPHETAQGHIGGPGTRIETGAVGWTARLEQVDRNMATLIADALPTIEEKSAQDKFAALKHLEALRSRARINIEEFPTAAWDGKAGEAPESELAYRSLGSSFQHDRLQRSIASMQLVDTNDPIYGQAVYLGAGKTPAFYDRGTTYKFTALTGVQDDALKVAILASNRRWGGVEINGNKEFREAALKAAAELGVKVSNPELQEEWTRLRSETQRRHENQTRAFNEVLGALPQDQQKLARTFGAFDTERILPKALFGANGRATAHVLVRGLFTEGDAKIAVFENVRGKLQTMVIEPDMEGLEVLEQAAKNGIWQGGVQIASGGSKPIEFTYSQQISESLTTTTAHREKNIKPILEQDRKQAEATAKTIRNIETISKGLTATIIHGQPLGEAVHQVFTQNQQPQTATNGPGDTDRKQRKGGGGKKGGGRQRDDGDRERSR